MTNLRMFNKELVAFLESLDVVSLSILPGVIAILLSDGLAASEQDLLGNFITNIGDILSTIAIFYEIEADTEQKSKDNGEKSQQVQAGEKEDKSKDKKLDQPKIENDCLKENQEKMQKQIAQLQENVREIHDTLQRLKNRTQ